MKRRPLHIFLALWMLAAPGGMKAQSFLTTDYSSMSAFGQPMTRTVQTSGRTMSPLGNSISPQRTVYGNGLFDSKSSSYDKKSHNSTTKSTYTGIAGISAYQRISVEDIEPTALRAGSPPPPTPDPGGGNGGQHQLPIGEGGWILLLMAIGYIVRLACQQKKRPA